MTADRDPLEIRPLLRRDTVLLRSDRGAVVRTERDVARLDGADSYTLVDRLTPYLTGQWSVRDICAGLGAAQRAAVTALVTGLVDRGIVIDLDRENGSPPDRSRVPQRFRPQLEYVAHLTDTPRRGFLRLRTARVLLIGNGAILHAAAAGLVRNGAARVVVAPDEVDWPFADALAAEAARLAGDAGRPVLDIVRGADPPDQCDLVLYCADRGDDKRIAELIGACRAGGPPLMATAAIGDWAVLGPVSRPAEPGCWWCAWNGLDGRRTDSSWDGGGCLTPIVARMLGGAAAFEAFRLLTGIASDVDGRAGVQRLRTLDAGWLRTTDGCPVCRGAEAAAGPPSTPARPRILADPPPPRVRTVPDAPSTGVRAYAAAAHRFVRAPLPPVSFVPDWDDRPAGHTPHPSAPLIPLPDATEPEGWSLTAAPPGPSTPSRLGLLAWLLRTSYGPLSRRLRLDSTHSSDSYRRYPTAGWRRGAVSGGGLYPLEIYWVAGTGGLLPPGVYHYAPDHHAFEQLAVGDVSDRVRQSVRRADAATEHFLLISLRFWRNAFKYANLAYHIGTITTSAPWPEPSANWAPRSASRRDTSCGSTTSPSTRCSAWIRPRRPCSRWCRCRGWPRPRPSGRPSPRRPQPGPERSSSPVR